MEAEINPAVAAEMPIVRTLFLEYARWLGVDLTFQGFEEEIDTLPGKYRSPEGEILLARYPDVVAGCVAMRPHDSNRCEMKRLWVREPFRGSGLGRRLVEAVVRTAKDAGYSEMVLDTLETMEPALRLYESAGFSRISPYYRNPLPGVVYLGRRL